MSDLISESVKDFLARYQAPFLNQDLVSSKVLKSLEIKENLITINLIFGFPLLESKAQLISDLTKQLSSLVGLVPVEINVDWKIDSHVGQRGLQAVSQIKNIIAVASGKGGVGKSTTAVNLALALSKQGARVGMLDADIYGPSQPTMLGGVIPQEQIEKKILLPIVSHGIQSMSIGYLVNPNSAMIWRGPMVSTALQQLLNDTHWDNLDYLFVDLPPGTGDIQLTLSQKIPVSGAVIVTTPQDLALLDARRAHEMFRKVNVPVLGIIENMSMHICSNCQHVEAIFGEEGGKRLAEECDIDLLGSLPLDRKIREQTDHGNPIVVSDPNNPITKIYSDIALRIAAKLSLQPKDYSHRFQVVVKND